MKLMELYAVQDVFATALGRVDLLGGGFARFVFYVERMGADGISENVIVASIIQSLDKLAHNRTLADATIAEGRAPVVEMKLVRAH